jgi:tetratricopeptide (TPR) repeat protein
VRAAIDRHGGREVSTAGDSFLAVFGTPEEAIACALEAAEVVRQEGLEIRSGIHTGEIVETAGDVGGIAVNIGARVSSIAGPGEVLVSRTVRDLVRGSDIQLQPRGTHELKGVTGQWRLYAVEGTAHRAGIVREVRVWLDRHRVQTVSAIVAVAVVVGLAGLYVVIQDRGESFSPEVALADEAAPGIAVLPFEVRGEGLDIWREGMVDLLSTGLDGVSGLRTISSRTVLARWGEQVSGIQAADLPTALEVASAAGARYALVGSAVAIGPQVRLLVDAYDIDTGERLGQAQVEGAPDDVLALCDRLGVEALAIILQKGEEEISSIDLASVMSDTTAAVKAYLEGEVHHRNFDLDEAREAYTRAVEADSMFALAHYRLARAYWWESYRLPGMARPHRKRAVQLSDRLPAREALLLRTLSAQMAGRVEGLEALREAVKMYPDDAEMWYLLGETLAHFPGAIAPVEEVEAAFERAVELDPRNVEFLMHYVFFAWGVHADAQEAARRLDMVERAVPESNTTSRALRISWDLAFGDSEAQADALARLETADLGTLFVVGSTQMHPRYQQINALVTQIWIRSYEDSGIALGSAGLDLDFWGRFRGLLEVLEDPKYVDARVPFEPYSRAFGLYYALSLGVPVPVESLEEAIGSMAIDSIANAHDIYVAGLYAVDQARWSDHERVIAELERRADLRLAAADSLRASSRTRWARQVRGYGLWKTSGPEAALPLLGDPNNIVGVLGWWWLGQLYQELGRFRDAERVYRTYYFRAYPLGHRELGKVYEALEEWDKALEAYEFFVEYWNDADPELQPMVEEARQAIIRLEGLQRR